VTPVSPRGFTNIDFLDSTEAIQIGGVASAFGAIGSWTTVFHDLNDPVGKGCSTILYRLVLNEMTCRSDVVVEASRLKCCNLLRVEWDNHGEDTSCYFSRAVAGISGCILEDLNQCRVYFSIMKIAAGAEALT
jgi:hypothetical protein